MSLYVTTCLVMAIPVLGGAAWAATILRGIERRLWLISMAGSVAALLVLTAVFDNVIIGLDIVRYGHEHLTGLYLGLAPLEDFSYSLAAVLLLPAAGHLLRRRRVERGADRAGQ